MAARASFTPTEKITFGTAPPTGAGRAGDHYIVTSNGLSTGTVTAEWIFTTSGWVKIGDAALPFEPALIVYVNATSPATATIFDTANPPVTNNNALKNDPNNLYIGTDGSAWTSNGTTYSAFTTPAATEWSLQGTATDAGANKTGGIYRTGFVGVGPSLFVPLSSLDVSGSFGLGVQDATAAAVTAGSEAVIRLGASLVQSVTLPGAGTVARRTYWIYNPTSTAKAFASAVVNLQNVNITVIPPFTGMMVSSLGGSWRLILQSQEIVAAISAPFYAASSGAYTPSSLQNTTVNGVLTMPADTVTWTTYDGDWASPVSLPAAPTVADRIWVQCRSGYSLVVKTTNTTMTADLTLTSGRSAMFVWAGGRWVWSPIDSFPRYTATTQLASSASITGTTEATAQTVLSIAIPTAGTWRITYTVVGATEAVGQHITCFVKDASAAKIPGSERLVAGTGAATTAVKASCTGVVEVTTTASATYTVAVYASSLTGTPHVISSPTGRTTAMIERTGVR